jgi:hypothetical protein
MEGAADTTPSCFEAVNEHDSSTLKTGVERVNPSDPEFFPLCRRGFEFDLVLINLSF